MGKLTFKNILIGIIVLALAIGLVFNYLSLNELSDQLNKANATYQSLLDEEKKLDYEITNQVSSNIDEIATEQLGMVKLEPYQIQYLNYAEEDSMSAASEEHKNEGLVNNLVASFNILVEYLR